MADQIKISALPIDVSAIGSSDILPLVTSGVTKSITGLLLGIAGLTSGGVLFANSSGNIAQDASIFSYNSITGSIKFKNHIDGFTSQAGTGTITLTASSARIQNFTGGAGTCNVVLPDATTLSNGTTYEIENNLSGNISIQNNSAVTIFTSIPGSYAILNLTSNSIPNGVWDCHWLMPNNAKYGTAGLTITGNLTCDTFKLTATPTINYVLTSDGSGNGSWQPSGSGGTCVTSATGFLDQVLVNGTVGSAQTGACTFTLPQSIAMTSTVQFGNLSIGSTLASNTNLSVTQNKNTGILINGSVSNQATTGFSNTNTITVTSGSSWGIYGFLCQHSLTMTAGGSVGNFACFASVATINSNRTIAAYYGFYGPAPSVSSGPAVTAAYTAYFASPGIGTATTQAALYAGDACIGYTVNPPTSGLVVNGVAGFGTNSPTTNNQVQISTTLAHGLQINGTQVSVDGSSHLHALNANGIYAPTSGATLVSTFEASAVFSIPTGQTVTSAASFHSSSLFTSNLGTITGMYGYWFDGGGSLPGGTITNYYGGYFAAPVATATNKTALYSDNLSVGFTGITPSTNQLAVAGRSTFGTSSIPGGSSSSQITVSHATVPEIILAASSAGTNMKYWAFGSNQTVTNNTFFGYAWNDALSSTSNWLQVQRTVNSATIQYVRFPVGNTIFGSTSNPINKVDINGGVAIGSYAAVNTAPSNGLIVSGQSSFGSASPPTNSFFYVNGSLNTAGSNYGSSFTTDLTIAGTATAACGIYIGGTHTINASGSNSSSYLQIAPNIVATTAADVTGILIFGATGSGSIGTAKSMAVINPSVGTTKMAIYTDNITIGSSNSSTAPPSNGILTQAFKMNTSPSSGYVLTSDASGNGTWQATNPTPGGTTSWTPSIAFGAGTTGITYTSHTGTYSICGKVIFFAGFIQLSNKGSSIGNATITGLPITSSSTANSPATFSIIFTNLGSAKTQTFGTVTTSATVADLINNTGTTSTFLADADFTNTTTLTFSGFYYSD